MSQAKALNKNQFYVNLIEDVTDIGASSDPLSFADKAIAFFQNHFGADSCKVYLTAKSVGFLVDITTGEVIIRQNIPNKEGIKSFEIGSDENKVIIQATFPYSSTYNRTKVINQICSSLSPIFLKFFKSEKKGENLLDIINSIISSKTVNQLSKIVKRAKKLIHCNVIIPLLFEGESVFTLSVTRNEPIIVKLWKRYKNLINKEQDIFSENCIITKYRTKNSNPSFILLSFKKNSSADQFNESDLRIQKCLTTVVKQSMSKFYENNSLQDATKEFPTKKTLSEEDFQKCLSLEAFVPALNDKVKEEIINYIANELSLFEIPGITQNNLHRFVLTVKGKYHNNPYHCWSHVVDVLKNSFNIFNTMNKLENFNRIEKLAFFVACLCHDIDHIGRSNQQIESEGHPLGILFKGMGVLEMHHCAETINILEMTEENSEILKSFSAEERHKFWDIVIKMILSTNMAFHNKKIEEFKDLFSKELDFNDEETKTSVLCFIIKCGDVGNILEDYEASKQWGARVAIENAKAEGNVNFQPTLSDISKSQVWFINFCKPLYDLMTQLEPSLKIFVERLNNNLSLWNNILAQNA